LSAKDLFFSAKGQIGRKDFWIASLGLAIAAVPLRFLGPAGDMFDLLFFYPHVCLFAKRCHDIGKSGWLAAAIYVPPLIVAFAIGLTTGEGGDPPVAISIICACVLIACVGFYFRIGLAKSVPGVKPEVEKADTAGVFS
jgi:uncharacterized membrane protein YhaH (DUF805 family)